jgi:hypothetical protein
MSQDTNSLGNPLQKYFRQPKIYIRLPSNGKFWQPGSLEVTENGEYPVYAMTAKDELSFKTPDSLINGQSTVDVIQSCIPNIKNAWKMPNIDLDAVLIALRIATYGEMMDIETTVPEINEEKTFQLDLRQLLDQIQTAQFNEVLEVDDLVIHLRPLNYNEFTQNALKTFEEQRIFSVLNNSDSMTEEQKIAKFNESFVKLTELNVTAIRDSISAIQIGNDTVTQQSYIDEFLRNADSKFFNAILDHIEIEKNKFAIKPLTVETDFDEQQRGAPATYQVPIVFDQSNFFA